ncbi:MAG: hypothetical protein U9N49_00440 [Campylobacterota bacterium]|nr:hypothetical protein [Campylobacterota bacterium]
MLRIIAIFSIIVTLSFSTQKIENLLVIKATKSTIEAEDLVSVIGKKGFKTKLKTIYDYHFVMIYLPKDSNKATLLINRIRQEYPDAFELYLPKPKTADDEINVAQIASLVASGGDTNINIGILANIPKKDLPIWGALIALFIIIVIILIKSYLQRREISKLQDKLLTRQKTIEKSIVEEKKTIEEKKRLQKEKK